MFFSKVLLNYQIKNLQKWQITGASIFHRISYARPQVISHTRILARFCQVVND